MTYQPREGVDARTRDGRKVTHIAVAPALSSSVSGFVKDHWRVWDVDGKCVTYGGSPHLDLVADWNEPQADAAPRRYCVHNLAGHAPRVVHDTLEKARTEAKRIAAKEPGAVVSVLEIVETYRAEAAVSLVNKAEGAARKGGSDDIPS